MWRRWVSLNKLSFGKERDSRSDEAKTSATTDGSVTIPFVVLIAYLCFSDVLVIRLNFCQNFLPCR